MASKTIHVNGAQPGMITSQPVIDVGGNMLVPAGFRLTPLQIRCLSRWGIDELVVEDDSVKASSAVKNASGRLASPLTTRVEITGEVSEAQLRLMAEVEERFQPVIESPLMRDLKNIVVDRLRNRNYFVSGKR